MATTRVTTATTYVAHLLPLLLLLLLLLKVLLHVRSLPVPLWLPAAVHLGRVREERVHAPEQGRRHVVRWRQQHLLGWCVRLQLRRRLRRQQRVHH